jgi:F-type H+-transporting ATPase subunit epsilon
MAETGKFQLQVVTPERVVIDEEVSEAIAPGYLGEFGVLPGHAAYLVNLKPGVLRYKTKDGRKICASSSGFASVGHDKMVVLVEAAEPAEDIDVERAKRARDKAQAAIKGMAVTHAEYEGLEGALVRAVARISAHQEVNSK